jgi:hypothetical protein
MPRHLVVVAERRRIAVVEQDEIDVARVVELVGAELAHAEHREGGGLGLAADGELAVALELQKDGVGQCIEATVGEGAERAGDLFQRPDARDVGDGDGQRLLALEPAQGGGDGVGFGAPPRRGARRGKLGRKARHDGIRTVAP